MYNNKTVSLVLPCYNEEEGLEHILRSKPPFIDQVVVVDNNSTDKTATIASAYNALLLPLAEMGYGRSCRMGLINASSDIILLMDGDATYPVEESERLVSDIAFDKYDFLVGCRFPLVSKKSMPWIKKASNYFISFLIRRLFSLDLRDSQSGMIALKRSALEDVLSKNTNMGFSQEIKIKAWRNPDIRRKEIHINYGSRKGKIKFRSIKDGLGNVRDIIYFYFYPNK